MLVIVILSFFSIFSTLKIEKFMFQNNIVNCVVVGKLYTLTCKQIIKWPTDIEEVKEQRHATFHQTITVLILLVIVCNNHKWSLHETTR